MKLPDGQIKSIYCHSDGYLEGVGDTLRKCYTTTKKIKALLTLGDISSLYPLVAPPPGVEHGFEYDQRATDVTVAYGRDRGEPDCGATVSDDMEAFFQLQEEYSYLWLDNEWHVWCHHEGSTIQGGKLTAEMVAEAVTQ